MIAPTSGERAASQPADQHKNILLVVNSAALVCRGNTHLHRSDMNHEQTIGTQKVRNDRAHVHTYYARVRVTEIAAKST